MLARALHWLRRELLRTHITQLQAAVGQQQLARHPSDLVRLQLLQARLAERRCQLACLELRR